jgi:hypothetical protein
MQALVRAAVLVLALASPGPAAADAPRVAVLPFSYLDTSGERRDQSAEHQARLAAMAEQLRSELDAGGGLRVEVLPAAAVSGCATGESECLLAAARDAGADLVLTGAVHKISTMATQMWVGVFDAASGKRVFYRSLSFRGDTDDAWRRATRFLARQIAAAPLAKG